MQLINLLQQPSNKAGLIVLYGKRCFGTVSVIMWKEWMGLDLWIRNKDFPKYSEILSIKGSTLLAKQRSMTVFLMVVDYLRKVAENMLLNMEDFFPLLIVPAIPGSYINSNQSVESQDN